ncbi:MAG TPA: carboxylating nicotinate-nucleotide diphosphorylase [Beijerinckiaceae bacterium]|nr:carboxylating nicotinate-nucleotide diphosphorylase [Beijerinckiaceae bacterium]
MPLVHPSLALALEPLARAALAEDLGGAGDITTDAVIPAGTRASAAIVGRRSGVLAGSAIAEIVFRLCDPGLDIVSLREDGDAIPAGSPVLRISGDARSILTAERTALNFLCRLSGIATATHGLVRAVAGTRARIACTRKTTPGLRALERAAVVAGGGIGHRFGLHDGILIKDNHIAAVGGIRRAVARARSNVGHMVKIEVEVDSLEQLEEALGAGIDAVLLDNMGLDELREGVRIVGGRVTVEASGSITRENVAGVAATGVDVISVGWITHSAPALDLGLDLAAP